jgi:hypothetical protein
MPQKTLKDRGDEDDCASTDPEVENELRRAKEIIEKARLAGTDQKCPEPIKRL